MDTNALIIAALTGLFLPLVTGLLSKNAWPEYVKFIVVIVCAAIAGGVTLAIQGEFADLTWETAYQHIGVIYVASGASFWILVNNIPGLREWLYSHLVK
jgi:hypothetical protein